MVIHSAIQSTIGNVINYYIDSHREQCVVTDRTPIAAVGTFQNRALCNGRRVKEHRVANELSFLQVTVFFFNKVDHRSRPFQVF